MGYIRSMDTVLSRFPVGDEWLHYIRVGEMPEGGVGTLLVAAILDDDIAVMEEFCAFIAQTVLWWDLTDDDDGPVSVTTSVLRTLPIEFVAGFAVHIVQELLGKGDNE